MASLHAIQEVLNDPVIKCKQAKDVCWLSHDNAVNAIVSSLPSLLVSLDREASENNEPTALGLFKFMKTYNFVACIYLPSDILPHLSRFSRIFQKENVDLSLIQPCLKSTIDAISAYEHTDGLNLRKVERILTSDLKDFHIPTTTNLKENFKRSIQCVYIQATIRHLVDCFPQVEIMDAFNIFNPNSLPANDEELDDYGLDRLDVLLKTFGEGPNAKVDSIECKSEWEGLRRLMQTRYLSFMLRQILQIFSTDQTLRDMFPNLASLCTIAALIPVSTAECERAFSSMNRIKVELRNRLKTLTLDRLMRISIEGPPACDFNFDKAADLWGGMRNRRISIGSCSSTT